MTIAEKFDHQVIEAKWQKYWEEHKINEAKDGVKPKAYVLDMFPYPSGDGLHVGHVEGYTASDIYSRFLRMNGYNVLHPMGWDAFGLPAENYAIKQKIHPRIVTEKNIAKFKEQLMSLGLSYDWSREINTTDPNYYKWTQWIFLKLFSNGLAYQAEVPINWCPSCQTVLANEEVVDGRCDRCGTNVEKKNKKQWLLKITAYADRLLDDLKDLDWPEKIITMQRNWIGRSEGAEIKFKINGIEEEVVVFTTRPDTLFGATYLVLAPDHYLVSILTTTDQKKAVDAYVQATKNKTEVERVDLSKQKTGVFTGSFAINPGTGEQVPIWIADYVLVTYGTGAIMAVPAHDERDFDFASKYNLPLRQVVVDQDAGLDVTSAYTGEGLLINSGKFNHLTSQDARKKIISWLKKQNLGQATTKYKLRDWVFSRQRYWGEPIPVVHCANCGTVPVSEKDLPVLLPDVKNYAPAGTGESPLSTITEWVNTACPQCGASAKRETDTMPQWAGSSWYWLRYIDPNNKKELFSKAQAKSWLPVDVYIGGAEHAVLHLLYARFWHKVLYDEKFVNHKEPFKKLINQGLIMAEDGRKMSKSLGNVVNPDASIKEVGADTLRMFEMFLGPLADSKPWDTKGLVGVRRFLDKLWVLSKRVGAENLTSAQEISINSLTKKITEDISNWRLNTAVSSLMSAYNEISDSEIVPLDYWERYLKLLAPLAPHLAEELWFISGHSASIFIEAWPKYDDNKVRHQNEIVVQVNGKVRDRLDLLEGETEAEILQKALSLANVKKYLDNKKIIKTIYVPGRLINIVVQ